jgi:hypothetical protein
VTPQGHVDAALVYPVLPSAFGRADGERYRCRMGDKTTAASFGGLVVAMWIIWGIGCVLAVIGCWVLAFLTVMTFGNPVAPDQSAQGRLWLNTAAVISVMAGAAVVALAVTLLRRDGKHGGTILAIVLAVASPCMAVAAATLGTIAGE